MTHDELLAKVETDQEITEYLNFGLMNGDIKINTARQHWFQSNALRAVVELHKPFQVATGGSWTPEGSTQTFETTCNHCGQLNSAAMVLYPCPTIQAIEKELS